MAEMPKAKQYGTFPMNSPYPRNDNAMQQNFMPSQEHGTTTKTGAVNSVSRSRDEMQSTESMHRQ